MIDATSRPGLAGLRERGAALIAMAAVGAVLCLHGASAQAPAPRPSPAPRPAASDKPAPASPAPGAPSPTAAAEAEAAYAASKAAFDALAESDRRAVQEALIWTGDYQGVADGEFGKRTREALIAFEKRVGNKPDGRIDGAEQGKLVGKAQELKKAVGFAPVADPVSGAQIGVPQKLMPKKTAEANGQTFAAADDSRKLTTFVLTGPDADLPRYFEAASAATPDRKVTYKVLKPDFAVIGSESGGAKTYTRLTRVANGGETLLRGFTLTYPASAAREFNTVALAIANSFNPQGKAGGAAPTPASAPTAVPVAPVKDAPAQVAVAVTPAPVAKPPAPGPTMTVTATLLAAGKAVAVLPAACAAPMVAGAPVKILAGDAETGLAVLEVASAKAAPVSFSPTSIADGAPLVIAGFAEASAPLAPSALSVASGNAVVDAGPEHPRVSAPLQPPSAGSAVFDRAGHLAGVIGRAAREPRRFAGVVPLATHPVIPLRRLLQVSAIVGALPPKADGGEADKPRSVGEIVNNARAALIGVDCPR